MNTACRAALYTAEAAGQLTPAFYYPSPPALLLTLKRAEASKDAQTARSRQRPEDADKQKGRPVSPDLPMPLRPELSVNPDNLFVHRLRRAPVEK
ncbi:hypothetical protein GCM10009414_07010 [Tatumella terrea]